jgi:hypothetical protein
MTKLLAVCCIAVFAGFADQTSAQEKEALKLVQTIPLPGVTGRLDHMGVDLEKKRLFVAAVANNTLEVVDLAGRALVWNAGRIARLGLRLPAEGSRPLRCNLQGQD